MSFPVPVLLNPFKQGIPGIIKANARAMTCIKGGALSSTHMLDQSPLNSGTRRTGEEGRCYTADGIDDNVNLGTDFIGTGDITLTAWINTASFGLAGEGRIFDNGKTIFFVNSVSNRLRFTSDGGANQARADNVITLGQWQHVAVVRVGDVATLYVNGVDVTAASNAGTPVVASANLIILNNASNTRAFDGSIFDARIYNKALTAAEISYIYTFGESGNNPTNANLLAQYKCDEQSGTVAYDSSGNGNNGTLTNITAGTFHATQDIWSFQNQVGGSPARNLIKNSSDLNDSNSWNNLNVTVTNGIPDPDGGSSAFKLTATSSSPTLFTNKIPYATVSQSGSYSFSVLCKRGNTDTQFANFLLRNFMTSSNIVIGVFDYGTNVLSLSGTGNYGGSATLVSDGWYLINIFSDSVSAGNSLVCYIGATGGTYTAGNFAYFYAPQLSKGTSRGEYQKTNGIQLIESVVLPRDESDPTNDVLGNPLTNTGRRPNDAALHSSNCLTADGTLYIAAAHLAGTETVVSSGGTSTPSISAGRIDFTAGTCWDLLLSDGTHYKLAEGYGTAILDASGNGNHGVLTSAVLANAWGATQNVYHSNLIDGSGKRMWFDGASNYVDLANLYLLLNPSSFSMTIKEFYLASASITTRSIIFSTRLNALGLNIAVSNAYNFQIFEGGTLLGVFTSYTVPQNQKIKLQVSINGTIAKLFIDDVLIQEITLSAGYTISSKSEIGAFSASSVYYFNGILSGISFFSDDAFSTLIAVYDGYGNTDSDWIDITGNGNDGTVVGSPEAFYIPAAPNGLDVFGNELTEKPSNSYRNRAETLIDLDPDSTPEMGATQLGITVPASHAFGDAFAASDQIFSRQRTLTEDRFVVMPEAQTGSALATIQRYTQP